MNMQRILVPVDFSHYATAAMRLAMAIANSRRAHVTVLHVDPLPGAGTVAVEPVYIAPQIFEGLQAEHDAKVETGLREIYDDFAADAAKGMILETERRSGEPVTGILDFAREWGAHLIVMGSQGAGGIAQLLLGSTAEKVSRVAPCPVLIAGRDDDLSDQVRSFDRVIAAVDYSEFSAPVVRLAAELVSEDGVLEILHMWNQPYFSALSASLGGEHENMRALIESSRGAQAEMIESFSADLDLPLTKLVHYVGVGTPAMGILSRAEDTSADLIVLGAHSRASLDERILGTVADRVLRHARIPVLIYPAAALPA